MDLVPLHRTEHHDARTEPVFELIRRVTQRLRVGTVDPRREDLDAAHDLRPFEQIAAPAARKLEPEPLDLALERARAFDQLRDLGRNVVAPSLHEPRDV